MWSWTTSAWARRSSGPSPTPPRRGGRRERAGGFVTDVIELVAEFHTTFARIEELLASEALAHRRRSHALHHLGTLDGQSETRGIVGVGDGGRRRGMPLEVRQVREALLREFADRISMDDFEKKDPTERETALLSRALSARAARILTDCSSDEAAAGVIDGRDDFGIDSVAFSASGTELWLIQAKWKKSGGTAGFDTEAALKLIHGLKKLDNRDFDHFNERLRLLGDRVHGVLKLPTCKVHLVIASWEMVDFQPRRAAFWMRQPANLAASGAPLNTEWWTRSIFTAQFGKICSRSPSP